MSESKVSHVRDAQNAWKKMVDDQIARVEQGYAETARMQAEGIERSKSAVDEMAKLTKDSITYFGQLQAEWYKLTLEAAKKSADLFTAQG